MVKEKKPQKYSTPAVIPTLFSILVFSFAFILFLLAKGYRVNLTDQKITKTGALTVKTYPSNATIYIDDENLGKTPKSKVLEYGVHDVKIEKEGYHLWNKIINIPEETTTILTPWLLLSDNKKYTIWNPQKEFVNYWVNKNNDVVLVLLKENAEKYSLWKYKIESSLWEILNNPMKIWETSDSTLSLMQSPNGEYALLTTKTESGNSSYLMNTSTAFVPSINNKIDLSKLEGFTISWAQDNKHILFESPTQLLSYNITDRLMYTLLTNEINNQSDQSKKIWTTTEDGYLYYLKDNSIDDSSVYSYSIEGISLDGVNEDSLLKTVYLQKDEKYIEYYRAQTNPFVPFTNSPENTQTVGKIDYIYINKQAKGIFLSTTVASYWYSIPDAKYLAISHFPSILLSTSTDNRRLLIGSKENTSVFTFEKETLDPTEEIGLINIPGLKSEHFPRWVKNSKHLSYIKDNYITISEMDGDNTVKTIPTDKMLYYTIKYSRENIVTLEKDEQGFFNINEYRLQ